MDSEIDIEFDEAEQSIELERGLAAYFKTSADERQRLLDIARSEHAEAEHYRQLYAEEKEKNIQLTAENMRLEAENEQMRNRPQYEVGQYVERQTVERQYVTLPTRKKSRKVISNTNQLPLWDQDVSLL